MAAPNSDDSSIEANNDEDSASATSVNMKNDDIDWLIFVSNNVTDHVDDVEVNVGTTEPVPSQTNASLNWELVWKSVMYLSVKKTS
jgi:hypothetical protein